MGAGEQEGAGWEWLRGMSVGACAVSDCPSLMVPKRLRGLFTECVMLALARMRVDPEDLEAYKLFLLVLRLVLQPVPQGLKKGVAQVIRERCDRFMRGEWEGLFAEAPEGRRVTAGAGEERVLRDAVRLVKALELEWRVFDDVMRNVPRASGPGSSQWRWEHLWAVHVSGGRDALLEDDLGVNVRPIACREVLRKLVAKVFCKQRAEAFRSRFCGRPEDGVQGPRAVQIGVAVKGGAELGVHTVQAALDRHPEWVCVKVDAKNTFTAVHREAVFEAIERDLPELWAWTDLCDGVEANLGFRLQGVDGSAVLERIQERHPQVIVMAYLDDGHLIGPPAVAMAAYDTYVEEAVAIGLHIQPAKSAAYSPEGDPGVFAQEMPGARGELAIINVLGVPVGKAEAVSAEMLRKVEELCGLEVGRL
eukprot:gene34038-biopygen5670